MKKVILVTGASSGMGKVSAMQLIKEGHLVYGLAPNVKEMQDLVEAGGYAVEVDVTNDEQMKTAVAHVIKEQGRIDVLWNNAGYGLFGPIEEIDIDQARHQYEVNVFGLARMTQLVLPYMREQKSGTIINTSSMGGKIYFPLGAWYHSTKHAVEGWSDCLRLDLKEFNIDVVVLEPGFIETNFGQNVLAHFPKDSDKGPYKKLVRAMIKASERPGFTGSSPQVIADTISKIVSAKKPKTRYLVGKMAKPMVFLRKYCGDRIFDTIVMRSFK